MDWIAMPGAILVTTAFVAAAWFIMRFEFWALERSFRFFERAALRALTKRRVRPDYWDMAILAWIYSRLAVASIIGGLILAFGDNQYGVGISLVALAVWGIAERALDHAKKPRPIDSLYLLMWWECGRLHPPPYVTFG